MARGRLRLHRAPEEPWQGGATRQARGPGGGEAENTFLMRRKMRKVYILLWKKWGEHGTFDDFDVPNLTTIILDSQMIRIPDA